MAGNNSIQILRGTSANIIASDQTLLAGQMLYNTDKNYLTVGSTDGDALTKKPIAARELVGYLSDTDDNVAGTSTVEMYRISGNSQGAMNITAQGIINMTGQACNIISRGGSLLLSAGTAGIIQANIPNGIDISSSYNVNISSTGIHLSTSNLQVNFLGNMGGATPNNRIEIKKITSSSVPNYIVTIDPADFYPSVPNGFIYGESIVEANPSGGIPITVGAKLKQWGPFTSGFVYHQAGCVPQTYPIYAGEVVIETTPMGQNSIFGQFISPIIYTYIVNNIANGSSAPALANLLLRLGATSSSAALTALPYSNMNFMFSNGSSARVTKLFINTSTTSQSIFAVLKNNAEYKILSWGSCYSNLYTHSIRMLG